MRRRLACSSAPAARAGALAGAASIQISIQGDDLVLEPSAEPPVAVVDLLTKHKASIKTILRDDAVRLRDLGTNNGTYRPFTTTRYSVVPQLQAHFQEPADATPRCFIIDSAGMSYRLDSMPEDLQGWLLQKQKW
jgi:hypothetical protein